MEYYYAPFGKPTFTGMTNASGEIIISGLPAGEYGPFWVKLSGREKSAESNTLALIDNHIELPVGVKFNNFELKTQTEPKALTPPIGWSNDESVVDVEDMDSDLLTTL